MRRIEWAWSVGLLGLVGSAAAAQGADAAEKRTREQAVSEACADEEDDGAVDAAEPKLEIELGRSPTQLGYAIRISGGAPRGHALVSLAARGGAPRRSLVALDEHGCASIVERNASAGPPIEVAAAIPPAAGFSSTGGSPSTRATLRTGVVSFPGGPPPLGALMLPGDVVICEVMKDPTFVSDSVGEWFEVRNRTTQPIDLEGWTIADAGSNSHVIQNNGAGVWLMPRQYFVFGISSDTNVNGGIVVNYKYSSFTLANGADEIRLIDSLGNLVDVVSYDDGIFWPDVPGKTLSLSRAKVDALLNDDGANWCPALTPILGSFDFGTPRVANNNCP